MLFSIKLILLWVCYFLIKKGAIFFRQRVIFCEEEALEVERNYRLYWKLVKNVRISFVEAMYPFLWSLFFVAIGIRLNC